MSKPGKPTPGHDGVVEMDAMDVHEWDAGQRTPQASDANLAALVKQSASAQASRPVGAPPQFARTMQNPTRPPASGTPGVQPKPRASAVRSAQPARAGVVSSSTTPPPRRVIPDELKDASPVAPPPALTFDTAPQPQVSFDDPTRVNPSAAAQAAMEPAAARAQPAASQPRVQASPVSSVQPSQAPVAAAPSRAEPVQSPFPATSPGAAPYSPPGAAPYSSPGAGQLSSPGMAQMPYPSAHEAEALHYPRAVPEATAPPLPEPERRPLSAPEPRLTPSRRKLWWIGGGIAAAVIGIVIAVMSGGGSDAGQIAERAPASTPSSASGPAGYAPAAAPPKPAATAGKPVAVTASPAAAATKPAAAVAEHNPPVEPTGSVASTAKAATSSANPIASAKPAPTARPSTPPAPASHAAASRPTRVAAATQRPTRRPAKKPSKKQIVVDPEHASEAETPGLVAQAAEDPAIAPARGAYVTGNEKLFSGDTEGAIESYRASLELYPGYVGGYRGLGLAYAQRGDSQQALEAFKTYVAAAPSAKDVPLIKKRIVRLQHGGGRLPL